MNYIESVKIEGLWGRKNVMLEFRPDLNFLIGENGSGKTIVINLISAVLRADISLLFSLQFNKVIIKMKSLHKNRKPWIEVSKDNGQAKKNRRIKYSIKEMASGEKSRYMFINQYNDRRYHDASFKYGYGRNDEVQDKLNELVEVNWLPIQRAEFDRGYRSQSDHNKKSPIDYKLEDIKNRFPSFVSQLSSNAERESRDFKNGIYLSLFNQSKPIEQILEKSVSLALGMDMLKDLGVPHEEAEKSVETLNEKLIEVTANANSKEPISSEVASSLYNTVLVAGMIQEWVKVRSKREEIFQPKTQFEKIINILFSGKEVHFDERNIPKVQLEDDEIIEIDALSSGEKQLFILLGETLLQEGRPVVFISDEPEISLHVKWQSELFRHIRSLNRSCQIISATHSPDIVGAFQERVIRIEECISDA